MKKTGINNIDQILKFLDASKNEFLIWGIGETGQMFFNQYSKHIKVKGFIDSSADLEQTLFGLAVYSPDRISLGSNCKIIVAVRTPNNYVEVKSTLSNHKYIENVHFLNYKRAVLGLNYVLFNQISAIEIDLAITNACSLHCKDCMLQIPKFPAYKLLTLDEIIHQVDLTFKTIDYCGDYHILGGEPLLHPMLEKIIEYVCIYYGKQIGSVAIVTNGDFVPTEHLVQALKKYNVRVEISDYHFSIPNRAQKIQEIIDVLESDQIPYVVRHMSTWFDIQGDGKPHSEEEIIQTFEHCICVGRTLYISSDRLYSCTRCGAAEQFGLIPSQKENSLLLSEETNTDRKKILEFCMQICDIGYLPYCQTCVSAIPMYERVIPAAIQQERKP